MVGAVLLVLLCTFIGWFVGAPVWGLIVGLVLAAIGWSVWVR